MLQNRKLKEALKFPDKLLRVKDKATRMDTATTLVWVRQARRNAAEIQWELRSFSTRVTCLTMGHPWFKFDPCRRVAIKSHPIANDQAAVLELNTKLIELMQLMKLTIRVEATWSTTSRYCPLRKQISNYRQQRTNCCKTRIKWRRTKLCREEMVHFHNRMLRFKVGVTTTFMIKKPRWN